MVYGRLHFARDSSSAPTQTKNAQRPALCGMGGCLSQPAAVQPPASVEIVFDRKVEDDYEIGGKLGEGVQVRTAQEERPNVRER